MPLESKPLDELNGDDIASLVTSAVREGRRIDFKESLPGGSDGEKKEFLYDLSSFANAAGGDIIYGVKESEGSAVEVVLLEGVNLDQEILRLESIALHGIDPRIPGLRLRAVPAGSGFVLVVRIPRSWNAPHMVTASGVSRFYSRNSAGKYQLDVREIKALCILSESAEQRVRAFRSERLARIIADDVAFPLGAGPQLVLHVVPIGVGASEGSIDLSAVVNEPTVLRPSSAWGFDWRHNLDGFATYSRISGSDEVVAYSQVFRDGSCECVDAYVLTALGDKKRVAARDVEDVLIETATGAVALQEKLGVAPPVVVMVTLTGVRGFTLATGTASWGFTGHAIDRDVVMLPDIILEEFAGDMAAALRPAFDALWNAGGWPRSNNYSETGQRLPRRG